MRLFFISIVFPIITTQLITDKNEIDYLLASKILSESIETDAMPCENFYMFSCFRWIRKQWRSGKKKVQKWDIIDENYTYEFNYKLLHGKKESDYEAIKTIKFVIRKCTTEKYLNSFNDFTNFGDYNINQAYDDCVKENKVFTSLALDVTTLNCVIGYEKIMAIGNVIEEMFNLIKEEFKLEVKVKEWLDEESKEKIIEKLNDMKSHLFYRENLFSISAMEKVYSLFTDYINANYEKIKNLTQDFINNVTKQNLFYFDSNWSPLQGNAIYISNKNLFFAFFGLLKDPMFDLKLPTAMKFGGYGTIIGHEIIHGFDTKHMKILKTDTLGELLTGYSMDNYNKRIQCLIEQYNRKKYPNYNLNIDGEATLNENIADNGGLRMAYKAFKRYEKENGVEEIKVPGYEKYTNDQLFFMSYGSNHCQITDRDSLVKTLIFDIYVPGPVRVIGTLVNHNIFSDVFSCPSGSRMNPPKKCELWKKNL